jgi:hypothetical protein
MGVPIPALTEGEIVFEIGIGFCHFDSMVYRERVERGSPQIGMDHDSCGIDNPAKSGLNLKVNLFLKEGEEIFEGEGGFLPTGEVFLIQDLFTQSSQTFPDRLYDDSSGMGPQEIKALLSRKDFIHTRYLTKNLLAKGWRHWASSSQSVF